MSYPATEAGDISNDSIFSDSMEFDRAEKPEQDDPNQENPQEEEVPQHQDRYVDQDQEQSFPEPEQEPEPAAAAAPPPPTAGHMKPRKTATKPPQKWVPVDLAVPEDDPEDEFDIGTAQKPLYERDEEAPADKIVFQNGEPDIDGEITNCFKVPGLLYRIVNRKTKTWAFYNDSLPYQVVVTCTFGKQSKIEALDNTKLTRDENGDYIAEVTVYPCETELFVKGFVNGFKSKLRADPLSDDYFSQRATAQAEQSIQAEIDAIKAIAGDETDSEAILQICLDNDLPFVDLAFPPVQSSIEAGAGKPFKQLPWARPKMYLKPEQVDQIRLFRDGISPGDVNQGELGDCWFMCAVAAIAEHPRSVMQMFRHPKGPEYGRRERAIGAYRVTFNKNGLWRSVLVDDYLPVIATSPKFAHSNDPCEMWSAILEKAYAKLLQSYAMIQSGDPVQGLTDMTGSPSMRFDDPFEEAQSSGGASAALFKKWLEWKNEGYMLLLTTPGKAPAIIPGSNNVPDFKDNPELEEQMKGTSLLTGHAYAVLDVREFPKENVQLIKIRNAWKNGPDWAGNWSNTSPLWNKHANIAAECGFDPSETNALWMSMEDVLRHFEGGGVHFHKSDAMDYRVPLTFSNCRPSAVFHIEVAEPTDVILTLTNVDLRSLIVAEGSSDGPDNNQYPPVMLSLCTPVSPGDDVFKVKLNSSANTMAPSDSTWTFLQAREISMKVHLDPEEGPYLLVPRLLETETTSGSSTIGKPYEQLTNPVHFVNNYQRSFPDAADSDSKEIPVTLGVHSVLPLEDLKVQVMFRKIQGSNSVFDNFPKFPTDDVEEADELYYQVKESDKSFADERMGNML
ncbi:Domain of unknown function (DUF1935)/Calpain family cysteine protease, putative [Angomonas deanei]|uniref:Calpain catalytic domain-containing protein n=1 Tax=Angomonas deanei TaxID=59799 RepID=A0A7G2CMA7_9TRYP|nr:Domain of unknown function (DUF1935)/Calpain family cysteine protease, putative [Angomonas deanei]